MVLTTARDCKVLALFFRSVGICQSAWECWENRGRKLELFVAESTERCSKEKSSDCRQHRQLRQLCFILCQTAAKTTCKKNRERGFTNILVNIFVGNCRCLETRPTWINGPSKKGSLKGYIEIYVKRQSKPRKLYCCSQSYVAVWESEGGRRLVVGVRVFHGPACNGAPSTSWPTDRPTDRLQYHTSNRNE